MAIYSQVRILNTGSGFLRGVCNVEIPLQPGDIYPLATPPRLVAENALPSMPSGSRHTIVDWTGENQPRWGDGSFKTIDAAIFCEIEGGFQPSPTEQVDPNGRRPGGIDYDNYRERIIQIVVSAAAITPPAWGDPMAELDDVKIELDVGYYAGLVNTNNVFTETNPVDYSVTISPTEGLMYSIDPTTTTAIGGSPVPSPAEEVVALTSPDGPTIERCYVSRGRLFPELLGGDKTHGTMMLECFTCARNANTDAGIVQRLHIRAINSEGTKDAWDPTDTQPVAANTQPNVIRDYRLWRRFHRDPYIHVDVPAGMQLVLRYGSNYTLSGGHTQASIGGGVIRHSIRLWNINQGSKYNYQLHGQAVHIDVLILRASAVTPGNARQEASLASSANAWDGTIQGGVVDDKWRLTNAYGSSGVAIEWEENSWQSTREEAYVNALNIAKLHVDQSRTMGDRWAKNLFGSIPDPGGVGAQEDFGASNFQSYVAVGVVDTRAIVTSLWKEVQRPISLYWIDNRRVDLDDTTGDPLRPPMVYDFDPNNILRLEPPLYALVQEGTGQLRNRSPDGENAGLRSFASNMGKTRHNGMPANYGTSDWRAWSIEHWSANLICCGRQLAADRSFKYLGFRDVVDYHLYSLGCHSRLSAALPLVATAWRANGHGSARSHNRYCQALASLAMVCYDLRLVARLRHRLALLRSALDDPILDGSGRTMRQADIPIIDQNISVYHNRGFALIGPRALPPWTLFDGFAYYLSAKIMAQHGFAAEETEYEDYAILLSRGLKLGQIYRKNDQSKWIDGRQIFEMPYVLDWAWHPSEFGKFYPQSIQPFAHTLPVYPPDRNQANPKPSRHSYENPLKTSGAVGNAPHRYSQWGDGIPTGNGYALTYGWYWTACSIMCLYDIAVKRGDQTLIDEMYTLLQVADQTQNISVIGDKNIRGGTSEPTKGWGAVGVNNFHDWFAAVPNPYATRTPSGQTNIAPTVTLQSSFALSSTNTLQLDPTVDDVELGHNPTVGIQYRWLIIQGVGGSLSNSSIRNPVFSPPQLQAGQNRDVELRFTVTDGPHSIVRDTVVHVMGPMANQPPVVYAGADRNNVPAGSVVVIDDTTVMDPEGDMIDRYEWTQRSGTSVEASFVGANTKDLTFTAPRLQTTSAIVLRLTATDDRGAAGFDEVQINVLALPNKPPTVNPGEPFDLIVGESVLITAQAFDDFDPVGSLVLAWSFDTTPPTGVTFDDPSLLQPTITAAPTVSITSPKIVTLRVRVTDTQGAFSEATLSVTVRPTIASNRPPIVNAGPPTSVESQSTYQLMGSAVDPEGVGIAYYKWTNESSLGTVVDENNPTSNYIAPKVEIEKNVTLRLEAADPSGAVGNNAVVLTIKPKVNLPPVVSAGPDIAVEAGTWVAMAGSVVDPEMASVKTTWVAVNAPPEFRITDPSDLETMVYAPGVEASRDVIMRLYATDGPNTVLDEMTITIQVSAMVYNEPPLIQSVTIDPPTAQTGRQVQIVIVATDVEGDPVTYSLQHISGATTPVISETAPGVFVFTSPHVTSNTEMVFRAGAQDLFEGNFRLINFTATPSVTTGEGGGGGRLTMSFRAPGGRIGSPMNTNDQVFVKCTEREKHDEIYELIAALESTSSMRKAGEKFMIRNHHEDGEEFEERLRRTTLPPGFEDSAKRIVDRPLEQDPELVGHPEALNFLVEHAGGFNKSLSWLIERAMDNGVRYGPILMMPNSRQRGPGQITIADDRASGRMPFIEVIPAPSILDYDIDELGFTMLRSESIFRARDPENPYKTVSRKIVRILTPDKYEIWVEDVQTGARIQDSGSHGLAVNGRLPIVMDHFGRKVCDVFCDPPFQELALINAAAWNSESEQSHALAIMRRLVLMTKSSGGAETNANKITGSSRPQPQIPLISRMSRHLSFTDTSADAKYVDSNGVGVEHGFTFEELLRNRMDRLGHSPFTTQVGSPETATKISRDDNKTISLVVSWVNKLASLTTRAIKVLAIQNQIPFNEDMRIEIFDDFDIPIMSNDVSQLSSLRRDGELGRKRFWMELQRRGTISSKADIDEVIQEAEADRTADAAAELEKMARVEQISPTLPE